MLHTITIMRRCLVGFLAVLGVVFAGGGSVVAQPAGAPSVEQQLADRYVPVAYLREQEDDCAGPPQGGEPYLPLPIDIVLDNPEVLLRDAADGDQVLASGVGATDLASFGPDTYLDYPGDPRRPGCTYETHERVRTAELGLEPTTYVHIVYDETEQRLALQYWFFYYFNHWNNTHESDWEMIQLMWDDVSGVEQALQVEPTRVGYSQHGNGELATWGDDKIQVEDETHPLIYPAAGPHATFYSNDTFLAWGERSSGFGCDISSGPSVRTPLTAVVVPNDPDPDGEFAWLLYEGRWGERQPGPFNGVVGPSFNSRWIDPWVTTDNWRNFSIVVPEASNTLGPTMTDAFCGLTEAGSRLLILALIQPWIALPLIAVAVAVFGFFYRRSRRLLRLALQLYRAHWQVFLGIGLAAVPIGIVVNIVQSFLSSRDPVQWLATWLDDTTGARLGVVTAFGGAQQLATLLIIAPAVIQAVADIHAGRSPGIVCSFRLAAARSLPIALAGLVAVVLIALPLLTVIGLPIAIWLFVQWHFFAQVLIFDRHESSAGALGESADLVKGRWWKTLFTVFIVDLIATIPGVVVGFGLLTLGRTAVGFANGISSLLYALAIPFAVIAVTLMFLECRGVSLPLAKVARTTPTEPSMVAGVPEPTP